MVSLSRSRPRSHSGFPAVSLSLSLSRSLSSRPPLIPNPTVSYMCIFSIHFISIKRIESRASPFLCSSRFICASIWGPDVTEAFMDKYKIKMIVRSHECMPNGFGWAHNKKVLTVFSASSYYAPGSNLGAYVRFDSAAAEPYIVQFDANGRLKHEREISLREQVGIVEKAAVKNILEKVFEHKHDFDKAFAKVDPLGTGKVPVGVWASVMTEVTRLKLPWRTMKANFVTVDADGLVNYQTCLDSVHLDNGHGINIEDEEASETLYTHLGTLEFIFRLIDTDVSGSISKDEFCMAVKTLNRYIGSEEVTDEEAHSMADAIDLDGDGRIDFNEFTESFRLVREKGDGDEISIIAENHEVVVN